jgi:hypothetical protein
LAAGKGGSFTARSLANMLLANAISLNSAELKVIFSPKAYDLAFWPHRNPLSSRPKTGHTNQRVTA